MTLRTLVCACEDVTADDVAHAIAAGNDDMESLKRFTGLATGICQGRSCMTAAARLLAAHTQGSPQLRPTTPRPPLFPTRLRHFAAAVADPPVFPGPLAPSLSPLLPSATRSLPAASLPKQANIVVIGGGIMGLAVAYHLARLGERHIVVLERGYLNAGASGRNGGGIRLQWSTEHNVRLMQDSLRLCRKFAQELGFNTWLRQGGYLFVAREPAHLAAAELHVQLQNRLGVPTRVLTRQGCSKIVPELNVSDIIGGIFNPEDGVLFPWPFLWAYADRGREMGVHVATFTEALGIDVHNGRVAAVATSRGRIACDLVINAAAAWSKGVAALANVVLPNRAQRHEIMVTESLKPFLNPLVSELSSGLYFSQSMRGEVVAGMGDPRQPDGLEMRSSLRFIDRIAKALCHRVPALAAVQLVRQWAGCYDVTPDNNPIIGEVDNVRGFFQLNGFVGHGFMMAPAICKRVAEFIAKGRNDPIFHAYRPGRFADAASPTPRETMIIG